VTITTVAVHPAGALLGLLVLMSTIATLWWMLHPPRTQADVEAQRADKELSEMVGSIIVIFADEIHSEHMMVLAARLARRQRAELMAVYIIEVPLVLPDTALTPDEDREALSVLATAEAIARKQGAHISTEIIHSRRISTAALELARKQGAHLLVMGSYREGKYTGAPLGRAIDEITARSKCDVLIGVPGQYGTLLVDESGETPARATTATVSGRA
jgi:nucleotide-binding universal stress UspA family protein